MMMIMNNDDCYDDDDDDDDDVMWSSLHLKVNSYMPPQGNCVFWRPEESLLWNSTGCRRVPSKSDTAMTTCECDHLTVFAALIDPFGPPVS